MAGKVKDELHQRKPHSSVQEEALLNIVRTADALTREVEEMLKPHGLTGTQYNLLRILRGAGKRGATCSEIGERTIKKDPDITRLVDRMAKRGLVKRARNGQDRRVVTTSITPEGLRKLDELDGPVNALPIQQFKGLSRQKLLELIQTLEMLRQRDI